MSRECDSHDREAGCDSYGSGHWHDCDPCDEPRRYGARGRSRRNEYLSDTFGAYQGYWVRQSEYWYDLIGRFVCGEYRVEDSGKDLARFWDDWMADYQRLVQFPHRKANKDRTPNVVFTLDERAEGSLTKEVALTFNFGRRRPRLVASALCSVQDGFPADGAHVEATLDDRGYYAKIKLVDAGKIPHKELHYLSVVHTEGSREPIAVVHVVRRARPEVPEEPVTSPRVATVTAEASGSVAELAKTLRSLADRITALDGRFAVLEKSVAMKSRGPKSVPPPSAKKR